MSCNLLLIKHRMLMKFCFPVAESAAAPATVREREVSRLLAATLAEKGRLQVDLTSLQREHQIEMIEKRKWEKILRDNGLIR